MKTILIILVVILILWFIVLLFDKLFNSKNKKNSVNEYNRDTSNYSKGLETPALKTTTPNKKGFFNQKKKSSDKKYARRSSLYDKDRTQCAELLSVEKDFLIDILENKGNHYTSFMLAKRSGGVRIISAPSKSLLLLQKNIYKNILLQENIHPASMGFRQNISVSDNAFCHLGKAQILKVDLADFFGSIKKNRVMRVFKNRGYSKGISKILTQLCVFKGKLPQGAATSPILSNIIAYDMDVKLQQLADDNSLIYTRYADDITFSGDSISFESLLSEIDRIAKEEKFIIQKKKTRLLTDKTRKIITGVSISSGKKLTIPKAKKREVRKNVHFILMKGLAEHQRFIGSKDPAYLKRLIGYLNFWLMVEPDNQYVIKSIESLRKVKY